MREKNNYFNLTEDYKEEKKIKFIGREEGKNRYYEKKMQDCITSCKGLEEFTVLHDILHNLRAEFYHNVILNKDKYLWEACGDYLALLERLNMDLYKTIKLTLEDMESQLTDGEEY